jgi:hypothetical protein
MLTENKAEINKNESHLNGDEETNKLSENYKKNF